jgi:hypothetical protein
LPPDWFDFVLSARTCSGVLHNNIASILSLKLTNSAGQRGGSELEPDGEFLYGVGDAGLESDGEF